MTEIAPSSCLTPQRRIHVPVRSCAARDDGCSVARNSDFGVQKIPRPQVGESAAGKLRRVWSPAEDGTTVVCRHHFSIMGKGIIYPCAGAGGVDQHLEGRRL